MVDGAVLARGIDALEDDQDRMLGFGPQAVLEPGQAGEAGRQLLLGSLLGVAVGL